MRRACVGPAGHNNSELNPVFRGMAVEEFIGSEPKETLC